MFGHKRVYFSFLQTPRRKKMIVQYSTSVITYNLFENDSVTIYISFHIISLTRHPMKQPQTTLLIIFLSLPSSYWPIHTVFFVSLLLYNHVLAPCSCAFGNVFLQISIWLNPWRRKWQPTRVFLPGKSHEWRLLAGYSPSGCKESDTTERFHFTSLTAFRSLMTQERKLCQTQTAF